MCLWIHYKPLLFRRNLIEDGIQKKKSITQIKKGYVHIRRSEINISNSQR